MKDSPEQFNSSFPATRVAPAAGARSVAGRSQRGVALVITLIMLSVITFLAVAFLAVSRRDRAAVTTSLNQTDSRFMADMALARFQAEVVSRMMARSNLYDYDLMLTRNYVNPFGYADLGDTLDTNNVNYDMTSGGGTLGADDRVRNIGNLFFDPRAPVYVKDRAGVTDFRFYLDYNRNGRFETNGWVLAQDNSGQFLRDGDNNVISNLLSGEPEWIGVLQDPKQPHGPDNRFIGRYLYLALPIGKTLDLNFIHNYAKGNVGMPATMNSGDGFLRDEGFGSWELNFASFLVDLNTNMYVSSAITLYDYFPDVSSGAVFNRGDAFNDASSFLRYRYDNNFGNLASVANLFPGGGGARSGVVPFQTDFIDGYTTRPALFAPFRTTIDPDQNLTSSPWHGADNAKRYFTPQELFDGSKTSQNFTNKLRTVSTNVGSYDRYTFARLLESIGMGSAPEVKGKINLNYTNDPTVNIVSTNFVEWAPSNFFAVTAERLIRDNLIAQFVSPGVTNFYMFNTNDLANLVRTNFSYRNIQIFPFNEYSAPVHRLLQLAANIYDATTTNRFPTVFRPIFGADSSGTNIVNFIAETNAMFIQTALAGSGMQNRYAISNFNGFVWGVPLVIGARKGFPNFNEFVVQTSVQVSRNLQIRKQSTNFPPVFTETNQMLQLGISNVFGMELWNSYRMPYTNTLRLIATNVFSVALTNQSGQILWPQTGRPLVTNFSVAPLNSTFWPGTFPNINSSFVTMATNNLTFLPDSQYFVRFNTFGRPTTNYESNVGFPVPTWGLAMTNQLLYILVDISDVNNQRVVDFVNLDGMNSAIDISRELLGSEYLQQNVAMSPVESVWLTNRMGSASNSVTEGVLSQIQISLGDTPVDESDWTSYSIPNPIGPQKDRAIAIFRKFMGLTAYPPYQNERPPYGLVHQAPFSPVRKLDQTATWQVNDPLVHYVTQDLVDTTTPTNGILNQVRIPPNNPPPQTNLKKLNERYRPWGGNHPPGQNGQETDEGFNYEVRVKDPGVRSSDDWDFPTNKFPNIGTLGRVHRGTPWQTIYMKGGAITNTDWFSWAGHYQSNPTNDWKLMDAFTVSANDNAGRGLLSVNQTNLAAWSAVLGGMIVLSNAAPDAVAVANQRGTPQFESVVIQPNSQSLFNIVNDINQTRLTQFGGVFQSMGQILATPSLSAGYVFPDNAVFSTSPFLNVVNSDKQRRYGVTDEAYERIPQQMMSLLKLGEPRFVVYSYGQSLRPANQSVVLSPKDERLFNLVTNYQITGEVATRTILRVEGTPQNPKAVIESYNVLPTD